MRRCDIQPSAAARRDGRSRKVSRVLVDAVAGGIEAGHDRGVGGKRLGDGRVRPAESEASRGEGVERRRFASARFGADRVGAGRVQRHQQDRRSDRLGAGARRSRLRAFAASRQEEDEKDGESRRPPDQERGARAGHRFRVAQAPSGPPMSRGAGRFGKRTLPRGPRPLADGSCNWKTSRSRTRRRQGPRAGRLPPPRGSRCRGRGSRSSRRSARRRRL